ncbi:Solute carrier family 2, facilitated glucose transporter member 1 [Toxocara canis]|nr:Solute carrier family 2, facilitated glucose transporter member 1 [Toxocara canis]
MGRLSLYLAILSLGACFNGNFQQAYLLSILNQPYLEVHEFINESTIYRTGEPIDPLYLDMLWSIINVMNPISGIVGQLLAYLICDRIGRRWTAIVSCIIAIPGLLISMLSRYFFPYYEFLIVGRFLWGTANGVAIVVQTVWIVESAPTDQRGKVNSWQEVIATSGNLLTQAVGVPLATATLWPFMFAVPLGVNIICLIIFVLMYESPQYLLMYRHNREGAAKAIGAYHGTSNEIEIQKQVQKCEEDGQKKQEAVKNAKEKQPNGMEVMFMPWRANDPTSVVVRYGAWVGIMVKIAYVFTGARVIRSFNTFIYHDLGSWSKSFAQWGSLANTIVRLPLSVIPIFIIEHVGRRPMLIVSQVVSIITLTITMISIFIGPAAKIGTLLGVSLLLFATSLGIGSISRFYSAELVPKNMLLRTVTVLSLIESSTKIALDFGFYPLAAVTRGYSFLIFIIPSIAFLILMVLYCPETKKRPVNAILNQMAAKLKVDVTFKV